MSANLQIEYSPEGIATVREKRFVFEDPRAEKEWATDYARALTRKREQETVQLLLERAREIQKRTQAAVDAANIAFAERFHRLVTQWNNETGHYSVTFKRAMHPCYQQIIGMGEKALPFILRDLRERPTGQWFWALNAITGESPTLDQRSIDDAVQAWLRWGTERGYI